MNASKFNMDEFAHILFTIVLVIYLIEIYGEIVEEEMCPFVHGSSEGH